MRAAPSHEPDTLNEDPQKAIEHIVAQIVDIVRLLGVSEDATHARRQLRSKLQSALTKEPSLEAASVQQPVHWTPLRFPTANGDAGLTIEAKPYGSAGFHYRLAETIRADDNQVVSEAIVWVEPNGNARELKCKVLEGGSLKSLFINLMGRYQKQPLVRDIAEKEGEINITGMGTFAQWQKALEFINAYIAAVFPDLHKALEEGTIRRDLEE